MAANTAKKSAVKEIIGRVANITHVGNLWGKWQSSVDKTVTDYAFWDKFRRGKARGYEIAALIAAPIASILASWVVGSGLQAQVEDEYTQDLLNRFLQRMRGTFIALFTDLYSLGDQYIIVNSDGTISIPSPNTVTVEYDATDYRKIIHAVVTTRLDVFEITDTYTPEKRILTLKNISSKLQTYGELTLSPLQSVTVEYDNLISKVPITHLTNNRSANEVYGRAETEALLSTLSKYDDLLTKALDGAVMLANPIPVLQGMEDVNETIEANQDSVDELPTDSTSITGRARLAWDRMTAVIIGKGGSFSFASPQRGFTDDTQGLLKTLFKIIGEFTRIPDVVWGFELSSSRASAVEQMQTFYSHIEAKRLSLSGLGADVALGLPAQGGLLDMLDTWLHYRSLTDRQVQLMPVQLIWSELSQTDRNQRLQELNAAFDRGMLSKHTYLNLLQLVPNADDEITKVNAELTAAEESDDSIGWSYKQELQSA